VPGSASIALVKTYGVLGLACLPVIGCRSHQAQVAPSIEFTKLPPAGEGSAYLLRPIAGRVTGAKPNQRVVLFARAGVWWLQPLGIEHPFTAIQRDSTWNNSTHPGTAYAALLVDARYKPPLTLDELPRPGGPVEAVVTAEGSKLDQGAIKKLDFSGYEWLVRETEGSPAGSRNQYDCANAWVDDKGFLHLRITSVPGETPVRWTSAEVRLVPSLGYGSYRFVVSDVSRLEPPVVLSISNGSGPTREMDIEISRWGALTGKNSQYVVQPFDVAANVVRFLSPPGRLSYSFDWEPGRIGFRTVRGAGPGGNADLIAAHLFTSGVPSPGSETLHLNLYIFENKSVRIQHGAEVIIEKFEYLP
jgi:hypothetical protein